MKRVALLLVISLVGCFVIGEIAARLTGHYAPRPAVYAPDDALGWAPTPNISHKYRGSDFSMYVTTDENGFRNPVPLLNEPLVVCVGDSYVFGWGVNDDETYPYSLDRKLEGARVVNLGVGGYGMVQSARRLQAFLATYPGANVCAIVVSGCSNDARNDRHVPDITYMRPAAMRYPSHLLNMVALAVYGLKGRKDPELWGFHTSRDGPVAHATLDAMERIAVMAGKRGACVFWHVVDDSAYASALGVPAVPINPVYNDHGGGHFTPETNDRWAAAIAESLRTRECVGYEQVP